MDRASVLKAIGVLRENTGNAFYFATGLTMMNETGGGRIEAERIEPYYDARLKEHDQWNSANLQAIKTLHAERYPIPDNWHDLNISVPQICFSQIPLVNYEDGTTADCFWIIGCGYNSFERRIPADCNLLRSGDVLFADGKIMSLFPGRYESYIDGMRDSGISRDTEVLAGIMDESVVREWESIYRDVCQTQQRLVELWGNVDPPLTPEELHENYVLEQWQYGKDLKEIHAAIKREHPEWDNYSDHRALRGPRDRAAKRLGIKARKGQPGRPARI